MSFIFGNKDDAINQIKRFNEYIYIGRLVAMLKWS